jgi:hypothetical protein
MYRCTGLVRAAGVWDSQEFWTSGTWRCQDCQLYASVAFTPRRYPLLFISVSGRTYTRAVVRPGGLSQRKISKTPLFLLPVLSDIPPPPSITLSDVCDQIYPHKFTLSAAWDQKYPNNITVSATCPIRYTPTILLFLLPEIRYTPKIILFLVLVLLDIFPQCEVVLISP